MPDIEEAARCVVATSADRMVAVRMTSTGNVRFRFSEQVHRQDERSLGLAVTEVVRQAQRSLRRERRQAVLGDDHREYDPDEVHPELAEVEGAGRSDDGNVKARWREPHAAEVRYKPGSLRDDRSDTSTLADSTAAALHGAMCAYSEALAALLLDGLEDTLVEGSL